MNATSPSYPMNTHWKSPPLILSSDIYRVNYIQIWYFMVSEKVFYPQVFPPVFICTGSRTGTLLAGVWSQNLSDRFCLAAALFALFALSRRRCQTTRLIEPSHNYFVGVLMRVDMRRVGGFNKEIYRYSKRSYCRSRHISFFTFCLWPLNPQ